MKRLKYVLPALIAAVCFALAGCSGSSTSSSSQSQNGPETFNVVSSFYPMHILSMNLTDGIEGVSESCMSSLDVGCIQDHTFTTEDLKKIEGADVFVENGLDLETFNQKIKDAYPQTEIISASARVKVEYKKDQEPNPHVWTSPTNYRTQLEYVADQLQKIDPDHAKQYAANLVEYSNELTKLEKKNQKVLIKVAGKKVLCMDEALPYFCEYAHLKTYQIKTDHEEESISAEQLKSTIQKMKKKGVKTILIAKGTDRKNAEAIAKETGATIYELNSCMTGEDSKDAYLKDMQENFDVIKKIS